MSRKAPPISVLARTPFAQTQDTLNSIVNGDVLETVILLRDEMIDASSPPI